MDDLISRRAAIDALGEAHFKNWGNAAMVIKYLPSAQPERLTDDDFETIRIHLNAYKEKLCNQHRWKEAEEYQRIIDRFIAFASAQPDQSITEWQKDFKGYVNQLCIPRDDYKGIMEYINEVPSVQPEHSQNTPQKQPDLETFGVKTGETCADAISRQEVVESFTQLWDCVGEIVDRDEWEDVCRTTANGLPSAQQWIPVSSGNLPKVETEPYYEDEHEVLRESKQVLMWAKNPNNGKYGYALGTLINIDGDEKQYEWDGVFNDVDGIDPYHPEHVIAWMPLPEPWEGGAEECH